MDEEDTRREREEETIMCCVVLVLMIKPLVLGFHFRNYHHIETTFVRNKKPLHTWQRQPKEAASASTSDQTLASLVSRVTLPRRLPRALLTQILARDPAWVMPLSHLPLLLLLPPPFLFLLLLQRKESWGAAYII